MFNRSLAVPTKKVLIIGAAVIDVIMELSKLPKTGEDVIAVEKGKVVGGCGYHVAAVLKYFQIPMDFLTPVGSGMNGKLIQSALDEISSTGQIYDISEDNGWNLSLVESNGERTFITVNGIETKWKSEWFHGTDFSQYSHIYVSGYELEGESGRTIVHVLKKHVTTQTILFDPGPRIPFIDAEVWKQMLEFPLILTLNYDEAKLLCEKEEKEEMAKEIYAWIHAPVIIRNGEKGAAFYNGKSYHHIASFPTKVVDTIGAGDSHAGGLLSGLCQGLSFQESVKFANRVASQVVRQQGGKFCGFIDE